MGRLSATAQLLSVRTWFVTVMVCQRWFLACNSPCNMNGTESDLGQRQYEVCWAVGGGLPVDGTSNPLALTEHLCTQACSFPSHNTETTITILRLSAEHPAEFATCPEGACNVNWLDALTLLQFTLCALLLRANVFTPSSTRVQVGGVCGGERGGGGGGDKTNTFLVVSASTPRYVKAPTLSAYSPRFLL